MRVLIATALATLAAPAAAQDRPAYVGPPVIRSGSPAPVGRFVQPPVENSQLRFADGETTCDGAAVQPLYREILPAQNTYRPEGVTPATVLTFTIDADGRPLNIAPQEGGAQRHETLQASLAAWKFPAGARKDCRLTLRWRSVRMADAETPDLLNYFAVNRERGALRDAIAKRLGGESADCGERFGGRRPAVAAFPDFNKGRRPPPGGRSWTVMRWNIDADGRTTDVETLGSSGDADLDAEGRRAVAETRMYPGPARIGCVYNFYRAGDTLPAPPFETERDDPLQACPDAINKRFAVRNAPVFPPVFQQRSIEGWALVRFDVAPWGETGNVTVIEAQPAAAFGADAERLVSTSSATPGFEAGVRCVVPVRYRIQDQAPAVDSDQD